MARFEIGEEIQFTRKLTKTNPDRVINEDEKGRIVAIAADGSYTVQLQAGDPPFSGITDDDLEAGLDDDSTADTKPTRPVAPVASENTEAEQTPDDMADEDDQSPSS
ncbi:MAG: hypothetical protein ABI700_20145 [Chloroflexota bacterium]